jgi:dihydroorotase
MVDLVIKEARVVGPQGAQDSDIVVSGERVESLKKDSSRVRAREEIVAGGRLVIPGLVDLHVHLREPGAEGSETFRSGTLAALLGGVTTVVDMPNTSPPVLSADVLEMRRRRAAAGVYADLGFWAGFDPERPDWHAGYGEKGDVAGLKVFLGRSTGGLQAGPSDSLRAAMACSSRPVVFHAEDQDELDRAEAAFEGEPGAEDHHRIRPLSATAVGVETVVELADPAGPPVHVAHVTSEREVALARKAGSHIRLEVSPHHLFLDIGDVARLGNLGRVNPPVRPPEVRDGLVAALRSGALDLWGTDHAPHPMAAKALPYGKAPSGIPGLDTTLRLGLLAVRRGWLGLSDFVRMASSDPASAVGLHDRGLVAPGRRADLVILPPEDAPEGPLRPDEVHSLCGWSPWLGQPLPPGPELVIFRGRPAVRRGRLLPSAAPGRVLRFGNPQPTPGDS